MPVYASPSLTKAICTDSRPTKGDPVSFQKKRCNANHPQVPQLFVINIAELDFCCLNRIQIKMLCVRRAAVDNLLL